MIETWSGDLEFPSDPKSLLQVETLRVFEDSVTVTAMSISSTLGHWRFETRLFDLGNSRPHRYVAEGISAKGQKVATDLFTLAISLRRSGVELQVTGEWRDSWGRYLLEGVLFAEVQ